MVTAKQATLDVLCIGQAAFDLVMTVDRHPGPDEKCTASGLMTCGGGPAANAAVAVARLRGRSAFAGYIGNDLYGDQHLQELAREGVDTRFVVRGSQSTPLSVILVKPDGQRTVVNHKGRVPLLASNGFDLEKCSPRTILFDGHQHQLSLHLAETARRMHIPTILDAGSVHEGTINLLPRTDYLVASSRFATDFTREANYHVALDVLSNHSPVVVITLGEKGLIWKSGRRASEMPAFRIEARDTTGAGDTFHGVFALALARGRQLVDALRYASAAAALCCTRLGARPGIPTGKELTDFLKRAGRIRE